MTSEQKEEKMRHRYLLVIYHLGLLSKIEKHSPEYGGNVYPVVAKLMKLENVVSDIVYGGKDNEREGQREE